jgi:hypothetical protein
MRSLTNGDAGATGIRAARSSALFNRFWLRKPLDCLGNLSVERIKPLADLPSEERFVAALLGKDRQARYHQKVCKRLK